MLMSDFINQHKELFDNATEIINALYIDKKSGEYYVYYSLSDFRNNSAVYNWHIVGMKFEIQFFDFWQGTYAIWIKFED